MDPFLLLLSVCAEDDGGGERELHLPGQEPALLRDCPGPAELHGLRSPGGEDRGGEPGYEGLLCSLQRGRLQELHRGPRLGLVQHQPGQCGRLEERGADGRHQGGVDRQPGGALQVCGRGHALPLRLPGLQHQGGGGRWSAAVLRGLRGGEADVLLLPVG